MPIDIILWGLASAVAAGLIIWLIQANAPKAVDRIKWLWRARQAKQSATERRRPKTFEERRKDPDYGFKKRR